jgi:hypothetical protein
MNAFNAVKLGEEQDFESIINSKFLVLGFGNPDGSVCSHLQIRKVDDGATILKEIKGRIN